MIDGIVINYVFFLIDFNLVGLKINSEINNNNSLYQEQIKKAWDYFDERQYDQVEQILNSIQQDKQIQSTIHINCLILQSELLQKRRTNIKKSFELASEAVDLAQKVEKSSLLLEAYFAQLNSLILLGYASDLASLMKIIEDLIDRYYSNEEKYLDINIKYRNLKSFYFNFIKRYDNALEELLKSIELQKKSNNLNGLLNSLPNVSILYRYLGEYHKAIENLFYAIEIINKQNNPKYNEALSYIYVVLGDIYDEQGELDQALEYTNKSLELTYNYYLTKFNGLVNLGFIFLQKGDFEQAIRNFNSAIDLAIQEDGHDAEIYGLVYLLMAYVLKKDKENQKIVFDKITTLYQKNSKNDFYYRKYLFSKAITLKENNRLSEKVEAQKIFKELINVKSYDDFIGQSFLNYLELLFEELKFTNNESVLDEIEFVNTKFLTLAENNSLHTHVAESMLIKAKICILKLELPEARQLLDQAQNSAEEKGLKLLSQKISKEHDNLLSKMDQWEDIVDGSMPFQDRLELAGVEDFLRDMIRKSASISQEKQDQGLLFLIVNSSGLSIFSKGFVERDELEDQLIAGLLSAINTFSKNTFKTDKPIERIKQGDNTLIIKEISNFYICYVFKGPSYFANKKMNYIYFKIQENEDIVDELINRQSSLSKEVTKKLTALVDKYLT